MLIYFCVYMYMYMYVHIRTHAYMCMDTKGDLCIWKKTCIHESKDIFTHPKIWTQTQTQS